MKGAISIFVCYLEDLSEGRGLIEVSWCTENPYEMGVAYNEREGLFSWEYLERGHEIWKVRIKKMG